MKRVAIIGAVLDEPNKCQAEFNSVVAEFKDIIKGRMGIPFTEKDVSISVVSLITCGTIDRINKFTGKLGNIQGITVKTAFSKQEID